MSFVSITFVILLAAVLAVYWSLRSDRRRHIWLLLANFVFYGLWNWHFTALLAGVIVVSYVAARGIDSCPSDRRKQKAILFGACTILVALLGFFKYCNFFVESVQAFAGRMGFEPGWTTLHIILPVGISFYIFQGISYIVSVFQKRVASEKSLIKVGMYLSFFPHLVAGPIIHASYFLPQLASPRRYNSRQTLEGCRRFFWGLIYKAVFADNIGAFVDKVFGEVKTASSLETFAGCLGFYSQIYFDFAGYSLMAIGIANLLGYELPENFRFPYRASSIVDFWRRWHISLSTWLRDYVYIPLGGNRGTRWIQCRNTMYTMLIGGLWHGASWNFVLWGALHGVALCINQVWRNSGFATKRPISPLTGFVMTQAVVFLLWIPFRAENFTDVLMIVDALTVWQDQSTLSIPWFLLLAPILVDTWVVGAMEKRPRKEVRSPVLLYAALIIAALAAVLFMSAGNTNFIYFQF